MGALLKFAGVAICLALAFGEPARAQEDRLVLDGVIVAENPAHSIALVRRSGASRGQTLRMGQEYYGYVLVAVGEGSVLLESIRGALRLHVDGRAAARPNGPRAQAPPEAAADEDDGWVFREISRAEAIARLEKEIPVILSETELSPRVEDGEILGLELRRLPDGTLLSEVGLLPGDLLRSINGERLVGLDALWGLLARLRDAHELRVVLERRGQVLRFAYLLTDGE
ncbi:MAG: hypothetical protein E2P02_28615 [Acidobacteria bacterium]|nr:MAG: hypothetical protein E2P02_28615 [Acidobacteriota bacterium]